MDRKALRSLSREELVELVLRLQEMVGMVAQLEARVAELAEELARRGGPPKTPENSSIVARSRIGQNEA